ncbi:MAG: dipeptidase [Gemmatimonadales bacterium]
MATATKAMAGRQDGRWIKSLIAVVALLSALPTFRRLPAQGDPYRARALRILRTTALIDGHNDIPDALRERGGLDSVDLAVSQPLLHTDLARLRAGGVGAQFWAAYVPVTTMDSGTRPAVYALEQIDLVHRVCRRYPAVFAAARTAADVERNFKAGRISCLIGIEGGHAIENSLGALRMFSQLGVGYMTLTHNRTLHWADAATDSARHDGLTAFGEAVVREMNRLGMLVDLSHVSDATMIDALRVTRAPVIYSHSSARALANHPRDVPDSILRLMTGNGGVVMVNFNPPFVSEEVRMADAERAARIRALRQAGLDTAAVRDSARAWAAAAPRATLRQVADHLDHIRRVAGADHVGLGSDFDGISTVPAGLEDVSKFPDLIAELLRRGWSEGDVKKVVGLNVLRVMREAERVARELQGGR